MRVAPGRKELTAGVAGATLTGALFLTRAVASATTDSVSFAGHDLRWGCAFRQRFGIPCPACGLTRSVIMSLHGQLAGAIGMNPAGPLVMLGTVLLCASLFAFALRSAMLRRRDACDDGLLRKFTLLTSAYGGLIALTMLVNWVRIIA